MIQSYYKHIHTLKIHKMSSKPEYTGQQPCAFLNFIIGFHSILKSVTFGVVDMDKFQVWVYQNLPEFNDERLK